MSFLEEPPLGSMLYAKELPAAGGDTMWANLYLAYENLSDGMKKLLDGLIGIRVTDEEESTGLDLALHDERGFSL